VQGRKEPAKECAILVSAVPLIAIPFKYGSRSVEQMLKHVKTGVAQMWINPNSTLSRGHIAWDRRKTDAMNARYLDLAEIALRTFPFCSVNNPLCANGDEVDSRSYAKPS
jgi:hypothetical protein